MATRRVTRFRRFHSPSSRWRLPGRMLERVILRVLDVVSACMILLLVAAPIAWGRWQADRAIDRWSKTCVNDITKVEADWMTFRRPPEFVRGDEPAIGAYLRGQPLVVALRDRCLGTSLWIRQGDTFIRPINAAVAEALERCFNQAEQEQRFVWYPTGTLPDEDRPTPKIIFRDDPWLVAKRWKEGSPAVEQFLRGSLGYAPPFRMALSRQGGEPPHEDLRPQAWGLEPCLQADLSSVRQSIFSTAVRSDKFPGWTFTLIPFNADAKAIRFGWRMEMLLMGLASIAAGGALLLNMVIRVRARRKASLDADHMATMTHSLKTPLAVMKFRCDSLRLGRLPMDQLDSQLIQIGEAADRMSGLIEKALLAIEGPGPAGRPEIVTPGWIRGVAEDLIPAFEAKNRRLLLICVEQNGKAALPALRGALLTLLENALFHGSGTVTLETLCGRKRFMIRVSNEGQAMSIHALRSLGRPFMRIRELDREGFHKEGQGLGLSLLSRTAEQEGWGLTFASDPGRGLCATLEIQSG